MRKIFLLLTILFSFVFYRADEGMWLPQLLEQLVYKDMKKAGLKITAKDIYNVDKSSLKDAIVSFGGFCTAEVISKQGLILTNHHCGFDAIQNHTTIENNYLKNGYWAKNFSEELPNPGLTATFIVRIDEVTKDIIDDEINKAANESDRLSLVNKKINILRAEYKLKPYESLIVRPFFEGNKYFAFVVQTFKDVRLVGAPPSLIGNYGKDTDNWMWPRHTGDFSLFRIYANEKNEPAEYSATNKPYIPKRSLEISLKGLKENDFTMVFGFPGRTNQYVHSSFLEHIIKNSNPIKIGIRETALKILDAEMRKDENVKIKYASKYAGIENAYKKWKGELLGLSNTNALIKKSNLEKNWFEKLAKNKKLYENYWVLNTAIPEQVSKMKELLNASDFYNEIIPKIEIFVAAAQLQNLKKALEAKDNTAINGAKAKLKEWAEDFYKEFDKEVDKKLFIGLISHYKNKGESYLSKTFFDQLNSYKGDVNEWAENIYKQTWLDSKEEIEAVLNDEDEDILVLINSDPSFLLFSDLQKHFQNTYQNKLITENSNYLKLQRKYVEMQMNYADGKVIYPDANSTLRLTYGNVKGYTAKDAVKYDFYTYLDGVIEKYKPGDYEFDLPQKLIDLYNTKDYGKYAVNGKLPVCFIATNHTTGGNSGSPALNAYGQLVGLNFDRVWEGTMSDLNYDKSICRNIMVDIRYVLFIIDKFAGAQHLLKEMTIK